MPRGFQKRISDYCQPIGAQNLSRISTQSIDEKADDQVMNVNEHSERTSSSTGIPDVNFQTKSQAQDVKRNAKIARFLEAQNALIDIVTGDQNKIQQAE